MAVATTDLAELAEQKFDCSKIVPHVFCFFLRAVIHITAASAGRTGLIAPDYDYEN